MTSHLEQIVLMKHLSYTVYTKSKHRLAEAGFNLRKFSSNSMDQVLERISQKEQHPSEVSLKSEGDTLQEEDQYARHTVGANQFQPLDGQRVLGLHWDSGSDQFIFDVSQVGIDANLEPKKDLQGSMIRWAYFPQ